MEEEAVPTVVRSAFAHSLRNAAPRAFSEFLEHWASAILLGKFIVLAHQDPEDKEKLDLGLQLPSYDEGEAEGMREGFVVVKEGSELTEDARKIYEEVAELNTPAAMLAELTTGPLKDLFQYVHSREADLGKEDPTLASIKKCKPKALASAMHSLSQAAQALGNSTQLHQMDPLLADAERAVVTAFLEAPEASEAMKEYLGKVLEMHAALVEDSEAAIKDLMGKAAEEHEHGEGCCGGHDH